MTTRQIVTATLTRFVPSVAALLALVLVAEPLLRGRNPFQTLRAVYVPLVVGEPLLMAAGFALCLWLLRHRLAAAPTMSVWRFVAAALIALIALGFTSVFSQGSHLPFIITASVLSGVLGAALVFGSAPAPRATFPI